MLYKIVDFSPSNDEPSVSKYISLILEYTNRIGMLEMLILQMRINTLILRVQKVTFTIT